MSVDAKDMAVKNAKTTYEMQIFSPLGALDSVPYTCSLSSPGITSIKSGDTFELTNDESITIQGIPVGSKVEFVPKTVNPRRKLSELKYTGTIESGKTAEIKAQESAFDGNHVGIYPSVRTQVQGNASKDTQISYIIKRKSSDSSGDTFEEKTITTDLYGLDLFEGIEFTKATKEPLIYEIKAVESSVLGLTIDKSVWTIEVNVTNSSENWSRTVTYKKDGTDSKDPPEFVHKYTPPQTTYQPKVKKVLEGNSPTDENFEFQIESLKDYDGCSLPSNLKASAKANQTGTFDPITFTKSGDYSFKISEVLANKPGYTYDKSEWQLDLTVNESEGNLTITKEAFKNGPTTNTESAQFTNIYKSGSLKIKKSVSHSDAVGPYTIQIGLKDSGGNALQSAFPYSSTKPDHTGTIADGGTLQIDKDEQITIDRLPVGAKYTVTETAPPEHFKVPEAKTGEISEGKASEVEIVNVYTPNVVTLAPHVKKEIKGSVPSKDSAFNFTLSAADSDSYTLPENKTLSITGSSEGDFEPITFNYAGSYDFTIKEENTKVSGYRYDESVWTLHVEVVDEVGVLRVSQTNYKKEGVEQADKASFENTYTPTPVSINPTVEKYFSGNVPASYTNFSFTLQQTGDMKEFETQKVALNTAEGTNQSFVPLTFSHPGTYTFTITEDLCTYLGLNTDQTEWEMKVVVTDEESVLKAATTYTAKGGEAKDKPSFTNVYDSGNLVISKEVQGTTSDEAFKFKVTLEDTAQALVDSFKVEYGGNREKGEIHSGDTIELKAGEQAKILDLPSGCKYRVEEVELPAGYTANPAQQEGNIEKGADATVHFTNIYNPTPVKFTPVVEKRIEGTPVQASEFSFTLVRDEKNDGSTDPVKEDLHTVCTGAQSANFSELTFTQPGEYIYHIIEDEMELTGYTRDASPWDLTVSVIDEKSVLKVTSNYTRESQKEDHAIFTNLYQPIETTYQVNVSKSVEGSAPESDQYTFELNPSTEYPEVIMPGNKQLTITGANTGAFEPITFKAAGSYTFSVVEINTGVPGYTYDSSTWNVIVNVVDRGGRVEVENVTYEKAEANSSETQGEEVQASATSPASVQAGYVVAQNTVQCAEFKNIYSGGSLEIAKTVEGESDQSFHFKVTLTDETGKALEDSYSYRGSYTGEIKSGESIDLSNGEHVEILGLPVGTNYQVEEAADPNFHSEATGNIGTISAANRSYASFKNTPIAITTQNSTRKTTTQSANTSQTPNSSSTNPVRVNSVSTPQTGDTQRLSVWIGLLLLAIIVGLVSYRRVIRKSEKNSKH